MATGTVTGTATATGTLFIIAAPSGAGKTSLVDALIASTPDIVVSISHTTRPPRASEAHGRNYHFITENEFMGMRDRNEFLESAKVFDYYYGTSKIWVGDQLQAGLDVILEIDWQGAAIVREKMPNCQSIFIVPPSREILEKRLRDRAQDNAEVIARRMRAATSEMSHYHEFDYLVVNDDFAQAQQTLQQIILSQRYRMRRQKVKQATLLEALLR